MSVLRQPNRQRKPNYYLVCKEELMCHHQNKAVIFNKRSCNDLYCFKPRNWKQFSNPVCTVPVHFTVDTCINKLTLSTTITSNTILFSTGHIYNPASISPKLRWEIFFSMGIKHGYAIVAWLFEIC